MLLMPLNVASWHCPDHHHWLIVATYLVCYCIHCTLAMTASTATATTALAVAITPFTAHSITVLAMPLLSMLGVVITISIAAS